MKKFMSVCEKVICNIATIVLFCMVTMVMINVILRYCFGISFQWSEEIIRYAQVYIVMSMCGVLIYRESHITMDIILVKTKGRVRKALSLMNGSVSLFVIAFAFIMGIRWVSTLYEKKLLTNTGLFYWWQAGIFEPIGMGISTFFAAFLMIRYIGTRSGDFEKQDDASGEQLTM